jgi:membrane-associated phospholipid phosphatase
MRTNFHPRWWVVSLFAAGLALLASFCLDGSVQAWITHHQSADIRQLMRGVSWYGDWPAHMILGVTLLAFAYWRGSKRGMRILAAMILALALAGSVSRVIKISTGRARPDVHAEAEWNGLRFSSRYNAFPSGHTATSTAFFATLAFATWRIGLPFLVIPLLIAFSRIYVGAHHLSDVVAAFLIGLVTALLVVRWIPPQGRNARAEIQD